MTCDLCDEKASVFLTQIVDGQMQKVNLCETCAQAKGVTDPTGFALADLLLGVGEEGQEKDDLELGGDDTSVSAPSIAAETADLDESTTCQSCGFTHAQFKKAGRLGCSKCYQIFGSGLDSLLKAMHKGTHHIGKVPSRHQAVVEQRDELENLRMQLEDAVTREAFEDAASLRDQILKLEAEMAQLHSEQRTNPPANITS
jgi:protein arginine kinase activator